MATYLDRIVAAHRAAAALEDRPIERLRRAAAGCPPCRDFAGALGGGTTVNVIAEVKRRSPSKGALAPDLDPAKLAASYAAGGASCLSVLTDVEFFGGSAQDLAAARAASGLPVLRKDFTVCEHDVVDARLMGADCVLLIVAALTDDELRRFYELAGELGMAALLEVHDEAELERVLPLQPTVVGVNQRDLVTFEVDTARAVRVAPHIPPGIVAVAESGITGAADAEVLAAAGFHAVLVGETLVTAGDPAATVRSLAVARPR